jgi:hypothetical protein
MLFVLRFHKTQSSYLGIDTTPHRACEEAVPSQQQVSSAVKSICLTVSMICTHFIGSLDLVFRS